MNELLQMSEAIQFLDKFYSLLHFPVEVIDSEGRIIYVNPAFTLVWGYSLQELEDYNIFKDAEIRQSGNTALLKEIFTTKKSLYITAFSDSLLKSKEVTIPLLRTKASPLCIDEKEYLVLFHEDQTDLYLAEEEIKKARDGFRESERLKDTFLNVLSHELRTPLNIILGYATIIRESLKDKLSGEEKIYLENLYSGSERLFKSITQMLEFAQIEAGNYKMNIEKLNLTGILKNSINAMRKSAAEKNLEIKTVFYEDEIIVDVDLHCVENAINNLLSNAVKFTAQGFIEVEAEVSYERNLAVCRVKDTGVGISSQYLDHLFQPFSQEDLNIGRSYEGNGLGLALSKKYIEKLGGSLLVDSIKGVGTTFTFTLPLAAVAVNEKERRPEKSKLMKILMLDDAGESYELLNAYLKSKYTMDVFSFRDFGLGLLTDESYKLIIFDVHQSHWEQGILICRDIKRNDPLKRPVIVLSSEFVDDKINKFYEAGADKYIIKPFSKNDLMEALALF
jgi:PAS domain S-box-containing protein